MKDVWIFVMLGWNAWTDWKRREISLLSIGLMLAAAMGAYGIGKWEWNAGQLWTLLPGLLLLLLAGVTEGKVGRGDGLLVTVLGFYCTLEELLIILLGALGSAGMYGAIQFVRNPRAGRREFAFVPFLLLGFMGGLWLWKM